MGNDSLVKSTIWPMSKTHSPLVILILLEWLEKLWWHDMTLHLATTVSWVQILPWAGKIWTAEVNKIHFVNKSCKHVLVLLHYGAWEPLLNFQVAAVNNMKAFWWSSSINQRINPVRTGTTLYSTQWWSYFLTYLRMAQSLLRTGWLDRR